MMDLTIAALAPPLMTASNATLASGVRLHYLQQGPRSGPALILLHGYTDSSFSFSRVMPLLPPDVRVIAPDFRGHGASDRPRGGYLINELADDVIELMDTLDVPSAIIVGHSMGSFVAQALAGRGGRRVSSLVLIGSAPTARNATLEELKKAVDALSDPVDAAFVREFQYSTIAQPVPEAFMNAAIENSKRMPAAIWKALIDGLWQYEPPPVKPQVPTLVIGGANDGIFSVAEQVALAAQFGNARLRLFDDVGHTVHWERPEAFVRELVAYME